jgi:hypothetical protein
VAGSLLLSCLVKSSVWVRVSPLMLCPLACYRSGAAGSLSCCYMQLGMLCFLKLVGRFAF